MTSLRKVVTESLIAFPEDAHLQVLSFLCAAGASDVEKQRVQQAWSAVVLGSEAFGRKGKGPIDPVLFGEELIRELASGNKELERIAALIDDFQVIVSEHEKSRGTTAVILSSMADLKKPSGTLASLQSLTKLGRDMSAALNVTYDDDSVDIVQVASSATAASSAASPDKAIMEWRRSCRGGKFVWNGRKSTNSSTSFSPLGSREHGGVEVSYGEAVFKSLDPGCKPSSVLVIGVKVLTKQPSLQTRAWTSYQCLHELLSSSDKQHLQLFPTPFGVQRNSSATSTISPASAITCVFEMPNCRPLAPLIGPALAAFLMKYPSVALTWCAQLGLATRNLATCKTGVLVKPPSLVDCFVKDSGHLVLGNTAFETVLENENASHTNDLSVFVVDILASTLALSRRRYVALSTSASLLGGEGLEGTTFSVQEEVVPIMEGSEVKLTFTNHACRGIDVEILGGKVSASTSAASSGNASSFTAGSNSLQVLVHGEPGVASINASTWNAAESFITVKAMSAGQILVNAVAPAGPSEWGPEKSRKAVAIRVIVVPAYPVLATELQEVISLVDSAYTSGNSKHVLHAQGLRAPSRATLDEISVMSDWSEIVRSVQAITDPSSTKSSIYASRAGGETATAKTKSPSRVTR
jgi:hypothetical protein